MDKLIENIIELNSKDQDFQEIYYKNKIDGLSYSDWIDTSVQEFFETECNPTQPRYDMDLEELDRLFNEQEQEWIEHIKATDLDLYIKLLSEFSFSIECSLDEFESQRIERERLEHKVE